LCNVCKVAYPLGDLERSLLGLKVTDKQKEIYRSRGCKSCDNQGYSGRLALQEVLHFDPDMDELIARKGTQRDLLRMALSKGFRTLADVGASRVLEGSTSLEEMSRVVDLTDRLKTS